ncbi:TIR domain-containing protein [Streptomyces sp. NBC_00140]|uniref:TIR domain-containing protein n=1 Tax=Streptomyces sp. NBC_00140 TaxID=2975664 RepID=UPI00225C0D35|nr:TIR domain-containing protein [Streptomyces sp. NBC_00140]MCX5330782.1 toll/interleukin-1 receptor domain-containing protein [Streptomyces sp. NBC_00140]
MEWPFGVDDYQYIRGTADGVYQERGLAHLVPPDGEPAGKECSDILYAVATEIANAVVHPKIPAIPAEDARTVVPLFGRRMLRPVDIVVSYADVGRDERMGQWMTHCLRSEGHTVDEHVLSPTSNGTVNVLRNSLRRAGKVIVVLSEHYLATGDMNDATLDEALSDESSDWRRLFPIVLLPGPQRPLPTRLHEITEVHIGGPDEAASKQTLLRLASAPERAAQRAPAYPGLPDAVEQPAFPGVAAPTVNDLVEALREAVSVKEPSLRRVWLTETGLDVGSLNLSFPLRTLLFEIARICREQTGGYERLAQALEKLEPRSPASHAVRGALTGMAPPPSTADTTTG